MVPQGGGALPPLRPDGWVREGVRDGGLDAGSVDVARGCLFVHLLGNVLARAGWYDAGNRDVAIEHGVIAPAAEPRAYELPYDLDMHAALEAALKEQRRGNIQLGKKIEAETTDDIAKDLSKYGEVREQIEFFDLPDPEVPEK